MCVWHTRVATWPVRRSQYKRVSKILAFRHEVDEKYAILCYYAVSDGNLSQTCWDNLTVPSSRTKILKKKKSTLLAA